MKIIITIIIIHNAQKYAYTGRMQEIKSMKGEKVTIGPINAENGIEIIYYIFNKVVFMNFIF